MKIKEGKLEELKSMREHVDLTRQDHEGYSPVHMAVLHAKNENGQACLSLLVSQKSAYLNADSKGSPLHTAVKNRDMASIRELLLHGASPQADSERSPLHTAVENRDEDAIIELLDYGAKVSPSSDGHLPIDWYGDSHASFQDGQSRVANFAMADKAELLKKLFSRQKEDQPEEERTNTGVRHLIHNHSDLACALKATKNKELLASLDPSLPLSNFTKEEDEALTRELSDLGIVLKEESIWVNGEKKEGVMWWSDQEKYEKKMRVTSFQVAIDDYYNVISKLRVAFNGEWSEWRKTAGVVGGDNNDVSTFQEQPPLHIGPEETIVGATTYTVGTGDLASIKVSLSSGRKQFWGGTITEGRTKMTTTTKRPLAYLSGEKAEFAGGYYQLTFHWEESAPCS